MADSPKTVIAPLDGLWRVGRGDDPLRHSRPASEDLASPTGGNRFDAATGTFGVLYFGTTLDGCFGETLARFRPAPHLLALLGEEWRRNPDFMEVGAVPADWRFRRTAVRVEAAADSQFLDVDAVETHSFLKEKLAVGLSALGVTELDTSVIRSGDRRVTRLISAWAHEQRVDGDPATPAYAGIRYVSRLNSEWECWALFDHEPLHQVEARAISALMPELVEVADLFGLRVH